jgi:hypothetical protein
MKQRALLLKKKFKGENSDSDWEDQSVHSVEDQEEENDVSK